MELEPFWHHFWTSSFFKLFVQKIRFLGKKWTWGRGGGVKITIDYRPKKSLKNRKMLNIIGAFWEEEKYTRNSHFTQIGHNSLNNGIRAVLTPFLYFQFFWTFCHENLFFWGKIKNLVYFSSSQNVPIILSIFRFLSDFFGR